MQRLALAVLAVVVMLGLVAVALRWAASMARSEEWRDRPGAGLGAEGGVRMRDGLVQRLAYVILFGVILGTSLSWLGDI